MLIFSFFDYEDLKRVFFLSKRDYTNISRSEYTEKSRSITILMNDGYSRYYGIETYSGSSEAQLLVSSQCKTIPERFLINLNRKIYLRLAEFENSEMAGQVLEIAHLG